MKQVADVFTKDLEPMKWPNAMDLLGMRTIVPLDPHESLYFPAGSDGTFTKARKYKKKKEKASFTLKVFQCEKCVDFVDHTFRFLGGPMCETSCEKYVGFSETACQNPCENPCEKVCEKVCEKACEFCVNSW